MLRSPSQIRRATLRDWSHESLAIQWRPIGQEEPVHERSVQSAPNDLGAVQVMYAECIQRDELVGRLIIQVCDTPWRQTNESNIVRASVVYLPGTGLLKVGLVEYKAPRRFMLRVVLYKYNDLIAGQGRDFFAKIVNLRM
jgi:hypothetical protein